MPFRDTLVEQKRKKERRGEKTKIEKRKHRVEESRNE